jgi:hypothetical protein
MNKSMLATLLLGLIGLSGFIKGAVYPEQIAFDYFFSEIFADDFKNLSAIEFKGKTEERFSSLDGSKFCLKPQEKLQSLIGSVAKGPAYNVKEIRYNQVKNITITDFKPNSSTAKLYLYHSVRVADNFYVFLSVQVPNERMARYVFEITPEGEISRSCKMD